MDINVDLTNLSKVGLCKEEVVKGNELKSPIETEFPTIGSLNNCEDSNNSIGTGSGNIEKQKYENKLDYELLVKAEDLPGSKENQLSQEPGNDYFEEPMETNDHLELEMQDDHKEVDDNNSKAISPMDNNISDAEEDRLLSDISELVDTKSNHKLNDGNCNQNNLSDELNSQKYKTFDDKTSNEDMQNTETLDKDETDKIKHSPSHTVGSDKLESDDILESVDQNTLEDGNVEVGIAVSKSIQNETYNEEQVNMNESLESECQKKVGLPSIKESAFQRLASLGVIAEETAVVESKESALMKLASRGAISITPAGGGAISSSISSSVSKSSTDVTSSKDKHRPAPKSDMLRQKTKKMKIDSGNSMDIDKDFNSLINFLSAGTNEIQAPVQPNSEEKQENLLVSDQKVFDTKSGAEPKVNDKLIDQSNANDGSGMDIDVNDDRSMHETDTESHDGSKSISHSSDHAEENDEIVSVTTSQLKNVIEEGSAEILLSATKNVFYNRVQEFNRDMSIAALTVFSEMHQQDPRTRNRGKKRKGSGNIDTDTNNSNVEEENVFKAGKKSENGITILEALSATGLRSIRYAREIPGVKEVFANDLSQDAVETIKKNIEHNQVENLVTTIMSDASMLMYQRQAAQEWYDAIDLDPYGCPSRFLDSAVQAVRDGGLLLVTCTDMAVLAGNAPETCYVKYGALSLRSPACHEMALRIALQCIESHANRYGRYIVPLLSFSVDFYIRLIVQVYTSPVTCKKTASKLSFVYQCVGCQTHTFHPLGQTTQEGSNTQPKFSQVTGPPVNMTCSHCHHKHNIGGPIWTAPMYNSKFLDSMLRVVEKGVFSTSKRMQGMLEVIREELPDVPLYYTVSGLCTKLHCQAIPLIDIRSAILNTGYRVSASHAAPTAIKTNAPTKIIWDIMRCWVHMNPVSQKRLVGGSVAAAIVLEPPNLIANFDIHVKARPSSSMRKLLRYQPNPEKNWGPGTRARCNNTDDFKDEKRRVNQNKNKNKVTAKKNIDIIEVVTIDDEDEATEGETVTPSTSVPSTSTT